MAPRYYIWDVPPEDRLLKTSDGRGWVWRDGAWVESDSVFRRATGFGGDADTREITEAEAEEFRSRDGK
jgi:hypothetical protein